MKIIKLKAPAKINVRLDVLGKRQDGYHDLRMINTAVSIFDDIECELIERGIVVECENDVAVPNGEKNIVYGVAKEILAYSNKNVGVKIKINKNIPSAAGMGGGSSNAASVLMGLNEMLRINLTKAKLMDIGLRFGADVPFFISQSPAIATGVGEQITRIKKMPKLPLVIVSPNIKVSTKWVFDKVEASNDNEPRELPVNGEIPVQFATKKAIIRYLNNDLETVTTKMYPVVNDIKAILKKAGALACQMTGSGPSVFGIFSSKETAEAASRKVGSAIQDCRVFVAENIN